MDLVKMSVEGGWVDVESLALAGQDGEGGEDAVKSFSVRQLLTQQDDDSS